MYETPAVRQGSQTSTAKEKGHEGWGRIEPFHPGRVAKGVWIQGIMFMLNEVDWGVRL